MLRKRIVLGVIGALAIGVLNMGSYASAHGLPEVCAFTSATGLPSSVNNVEGKGAPWSIDGNGFWAGTAGADNDYMVASATDGFGHGSQAINLGRRGLYYPVTDPNPSHLIPVANPVGNTPGLPSFSGDHFNWTNIDQCNNNGQPINAKGVGVGYCGRSVGLGIGTTGGHTAITKWESTASQLYLTDPSALGTLNANPLLTSGSCLSGTAVQFQLNGATVHAQ